jgi:hypothetical protein
VDAVSAACLGAAAAAGSACVAAPAAELALVLACCTLVVMSGMLGLA